MVITRWRMGVLRLIGAIYLVVMVLYFADLYSVFRIFNISSLIDWRFLILPTVPILLIMPTAEEIRDYREKKVSGDQD